MATAKWDEYKYFTKSEMDCKYTGDNDMQHEFMLILESIRKDFNKPMKVTSGFRSVKHPVEARKTNSNGEHTKGLCADIYCDNGSDRYALITIALRHGITRIGVADTFLHLGIGGKGLPNHVIWDYK